MEESIAEKMAKEMREVSVAEFFEKNRHLLGYENPTKGLITVVKEAVDNSVEYSEPVIIKEDGKIKLVKIGEFIDKIIENSERTINNDIETVRKFNSRIEVLVFDDRFKISFKPISAVHRHPLHDKLFEIVTLGGRKVRVTSSHSVFVLKNGRIIPYKVSDLKVGDYLVVPRNRIEFKKELKEIDLIQEFLKLPENLTENLIIHGISHLYSNIPRDWKRFDYIPFNYFRKNPLEINCRASLSKKFGKSRIKAKIKVDKRLMRLLGYFAAEGSLYEKWVTFSFGKHEKEYIEDVYKCSKSLFDRVKIGLNKANESSVAVKVNSQIFSFVMKHVIKAGNHAADKKIPEIVFNVSNDLQLEYLKAYINGDGYWGEKITVATVSKELAEGIQYLLALNGIPFSTSIIKERIRKFKTYKSFCKKVYQIYFHGLEENRKKSPLKWLPLEESGLRRAIHLLNPTSSFDSPYKFVDSYEHFNFENAKLSLEEAIEKRQNKIDLWSQEDLENLQLLINGDIGFLPIREIKVVKSKHRYVYDFSVPGYEKFLGGSGVIFLHNSLDATNEANILPEIYVSVKQVGIDRFKVIVEDNGPGVIEAKVPYAFGKFLYGSKFHKLRQSRGIQGLGIHGAILYSQLTTGKPVKITTSTGKDINIFELMIDVAKNEPNIISVKREKNPNKWHGVKIEMEVEGRYTERPPSVLQYLKQAAIANPYANITFDGPNGKVEFKRATQEIPVQPKEIKPHPYGVELGILRRMLRDTKAKNMFSFLTTEFCRVGRNSAEQICKLAKIELKRKPQEITPEESERLHKAMQMVKLIAPPTNCLSPLTQKLIEEGLKKEIEAEYYVAVSRPPAVYRGYPFLVECGLAYGGKLPENETAKVLRFANKVPLLYHQSDCAITEAIAEVDWRRYGLQQSTGSLPVGPLAILVHFASVWVPFTSEGKQAIANYPEIVKEIKLALQDAGRELASYIRKKRKAREKLLRRQIFERYIPEVARAVAKLTKKDYKTILKKLEDMVRKKIDLTAELEKGAEEKIDEEKEEEKVKKVKQTTLKEVGKVERSGEKT
ncbi:MAG: DNA topoisomerase VI subunit B [Candidatus Aenigmatarchaeota archaeon]